MSPTLSETTSEFAELPWWPAVALSVAMRLE
jgi:hypothetical protein